jgi:hypothetical protein
MTTTVSFTPCWKSAVLKRLLRSLRLALWLLAMPLAQAQNAADLQQLRADRAGGEVLVSASVVFELPSVVEDALLKGIPLFFMLEADLLQERWYWSDKRVAGVQRQLRLAYQPLTRRWRVNATAAPGGDSSQGLALSQNFDTLAEALATVKKISRWKVSDLSESEASAKYRVEFRFRLDLGQLPRPFQIGAIGQSEWDIQASGRVPLRSEAGK